jgi:hypothetical protein
VARDAPAKDPRDPQRRNSQGDSEE